MTTQNDQVVSAETTAQSKTAKRLKWLGIGAFMFFLIKGLAWLIVPALLIWWHAATGT